MLPKNLKDFLINTVEKRKINAGRRHEINKFKDERRQAIYEKVQLTEEQIKKLDDFYLSNYGEKIPYTWHRHYTAFTGNFDEKYVPELLYTSEFERFMSQYSEYAKTFTDKNMLQFLALGAGVKMPRTYISGTKGALRDGENRFISDEEAISLLSDVGEAFIKPSVDSSSGRGCFVVNFCGGKDLVSGKTVEQILEGLGKDFIIQERLKCHSSISQIYAGSVNTFRVITYRWRDRILRFPAIMRIGSGGAYLDNAHAGGMFIAVSDEGILHKTAFTEFKKEFTVHPDTGTVFEGYKIDLFPRVLEAAERMHMALPQIGVVNWDFTIDDEGEPLLIEANMRNGKQSGSIWLMEMAHGCGAFGENTAEVLRWLRLMKNTPKSKWHLYEFGNFADKTKK